MRVAITPNDKMGLMVAVYNGDPAPPCANPDPQRCNPNGLDFELDDPPLLMVEGVYRYNQEGRLPARSSSAAEITLARSRINVSARAAH